MKKLVALGCSSLMVATLLTGCGGGNSDKPADGDKRVVKFDSFSGGNGEAVFTELKEAFEAENKDITIQLRFEKELDQTLSKENAKGEYSDIVYYNLGQPSGYTETQLNTKEVMEISDVFKNINIDPAYANNAVANYYGDDGQYLLPLKTTPAGFFYNKELIGEGKKYELPTTWDEMWALGDKVKAEGEGVTLFTYPVKGYFDNTLMGMLAQAGGEDFFKSAMKYEDNTWNSDAGKKVLETISKLVDPANGYLFADTVANANAKDGFTINQQAVIDGKALFMPNGDWIVGEMKATTPEEGFHWGLMPLPAFEEGGDRYIAAMTEQIWIPKQAKNAEDAKKFLEFIYSEKGAEIMMKNGIVVPVKGFGEDVVASGTGYTKEFFDVFNQAKYVIGAFGAFDATNIPDFQLKPTVFGPIDEIATGKSTVAEWETKLTEAWTTLKANPLK